MLLDPISEGFLGEVTFDRKRMALGRELLGRHSSLPPSPWVLQGNGSGSQTPKNSPVSFQRNQPTDCSCVQVWGKEGFQRKAAEWSQLNRVCVGRAQWVWPGAVWLQLECPGPAFAGGGGSTAPPWPDLHPPPAQPAL